MFLGHGAKDKSPGGGKKGSTFANCMAFFCSQKIKIMSAMGAKK